MENRFPRLGKRKIFTRRIHREPLTNFDSDCEDDQPKKLSRIAPENVPVSSETRATQSATHAQPKTSFSATVTKKDQQRHQNGKAKGNGGASTSNAVSQERSEDFDSQLNDSDIFDYDQ